MYRRCLSKSVNEAPVCAEFELGGDIRRAELVAVLVDKVDDVAALEIVVEVVPDDGALLAVHDRVDVAVVESDLWAIGLDEAAVSRDLLTPLQRRFEGSISDWIRSIS